MSFGPSRERAQGEPHSRGAARDRPRRRPHAARLGQDRPHRPRGPTARSSCATTRPGRAPRDDGGVFRGGQQLQIPFYVLAAGASCSRAAAWSRRSSTTWTAAGRWRSIPRACSGERVRGAAARPGGRDRPGRASCRSPRPATGATSRSCAARRPLLELRRRLQDRRPRACSACCACGTSVSTAPPVDHEARERARPTTARASSWRPAPARARRRCSSTASRRWCAAARARLDEIAAVTFTENAATTMKLRLRERLERARADAAAGRERARARGAALEVLERAQISTIHALCAAILRRAAAGVRRRRPASASPTRRRPTCCSPRPGRSGWPSGSCAGDDALLEALDPASRSRARARTASAASLRGLARTLIEQRDLRAAGGRRRRRTPEAWRAELLRAGGAGRASSLAARPGRRHAGRRGSQALVRLRGARRAASSGPPLARAPGRRCPRSRATSGTSRAGRRRRRSTRRAAIADWTRAGRGALERRAAARPARRGWCARSLGVVALYAAQEGRARRARLPRPAAARRATRCATASRVRRYFRGALPLPDHRRVPGHRPAAGRDRASCWRATRRARWWWSATPSSRSTASAAPRCALFRRLAAEARERPGHAVLHLTQNFRSRPAILRFVNRVFARADRSASEEAGQPAYEAIEPPPGLARASRR